MSRPPTFTPPSCAHARTLATRRGRFAVLDARPAGEPHGTVLMLPGFSGSKEDFIALLEPLAAAGYRTVAVDGRGQYETDGPDTQEAYTRAELAADVLAQAAALDTPVHLLGHSLGGQISRAAVLLDRDPFLSLTLMSSGPAEVTPGQRERIKLLSDTLSVMSMAQVWDLMQTMEPPEDVSTPGSRADLRERWVRTSPAQLVATGAQLSAEPDRVAELAAVQRLPLHVISGERDDVWPVPLLDSMARRLEARRTVIAGAEHSPNTDRPAQTAAALADFWDSLY
ncbi:alpha/beta hydrolase [Streptomyces sp. JV176]|uniref:alpha/beta fold hydrolase n=1 Tax=Streptomyces sp. JV176 TaxID=858630 RepID=UPI002E7A7090|nr:alpha/beta hydrolase [Streptomyces sp. JV176]MEE1804397.1 alpha/beta hydrolase [Streptomyces sp. JV176]